MRNKKILLVDDEEIILKTICRDFEHEGYSFTTAASGEEAILSLQSNKFDLVVTDLLMPGVDGIAVLQEAKRQDPNIGAIILTGYGDMASAIDALRLGADDYLLKPCGFDELLIRIGRCLEKQEAFHKIKIYEDLLPVCCVCGDIRDDEGVEHGQGVWRKPGEFIREKTSAKVTHTYCKKCYKNIERL